MAALRRLRRLATARAGATLLVLLLGCCTLQLLLRPCSLEGLAALYGNHYTRAVRLPASVSRSALPAGEAKRIGVLVLLKESGHLRSYELAHATLRCYCRRHGYPLVVVDLAANTTHAAACRQQHFLFRRHCVTASVLSGHASLDYLLVLDADVGVLNPNHLLEEYVRPDEGADLLFHERAFNGEIMAGSYVARRTDFTVRFLRQWADYERRLPSSFHGWDQTALHRLLVDTFCGQCSPARLRQCDALWATSNGWADVSVFTSCVRWILGERSLYTTAAGGGGGRVALRANYSSGAVWARDGWATASRWAPVDFLFHGWQLEYLDRWTFAMWHSPLVEVPTNSCEWVYKDSFISSDASVLAQMERLSAKALAQHLHNLRQLAAQ